MSPALTPSWYRIEDLTLDGFSVFLLVCGEQRLGLRRTFRKAQPIARREFREGSESRTVMTSSRTAWALRDLGGKLIDLPEWSWPTAWRPVDLARFPAELPKDTATLLSSPPWHSPPEPTWAPDGPQDPLDWPHAYSEPGAISKREAEVRVLRGLRTMELQPRVGLRSARDSILLVARGELVPEDEDKSKIGAVRLPWKPDSRDAGDWETAVGWWAQLSIPSQDLVWRRSENPPRSFRQLADDQGLTPPQVRALYGEVLDQLHTIANRGTR